jgi:nucleoside-diphosphate-sugar epimerase
MATFLTGATGFLGSYIASGLLAEGEPLSVLVRAKSREEARRRLWKALQLHLDFNAFEDHLANRIEVYPGDLTESGFGLSPDDLKQLIHSTESVIHCAASLNRRSQRSCMNVNLRGTLAVIRLARAAQAGHGLRRFSQVSTVSVAGHRSHETVSENEAIDWSRPDYDAYGRTKKFAETMVRELLTDLPITIFRPSIILGDSRRPETTQFDMVRAFSFLAGMPVLPFRPLDRIDIVPADWVADSVVRLHRGTPRHDTYHLSAGRLSEPYFRITDALARALDSRPPTYVPILEKPFGAGVRALSHLAGGSVKLGAKLLDVFYPYLVYDTVFDSSRAVEETGRAPAPFTNYCAPLLEFARRNGFKFPYVGWVGEPEGQKDPAGVAVATDVGATRGTSP